MFDAPYGHDTRDQEQFIPTPLDTQFYRLPETEFQPRLKAWAPHRNVFDRLTDHQYYTGTHRERFDDFGNGRGLAGREYVFINDGMTESPSRCHEVYSSVIKPPRLPVVEPDTLGIQRYGTQNTTPKLIWLYRNGDKHYEGIPLFVKHRVKTLEHLHRECTELVKPFAGPVRKLYDQELQLVNHLEELVDGAKYLCTSGEPPTYLERLEKFLSTWVVHFN